MVDKEIKSKCETKNPTKQQIEKYKRNGSKINGEKFVHTHEDIIMLIIMSCRISTPRAIEFRSRLGFKQHDIKLGKEQSVTSKITKLFSNEQILLQHSVLGYRIDLYFPKHKLTIEVDGKGHTDRDERKESERDEKTKEEPGCKFIRINPDEKDYDEYLKFGEINNRISETNKKSAKKLTEKFLIDKLSKSLLELAFERNHSIKSKLLKRIFKYMLLTL